MRGALAKLCSQLILWKLRSCAWKRGKIRKTVEERRRKGFAIVNEILAILEEVPLGKYRMETGLKLRQAMLLNGIL